MARANARRSGGGFRTEDALKAWTGELHADQFFAARWRVRDVDDTSVGSKIGFRAPRRVGGKRDPDFEVRTDGDIETRHERGTAAAKIFAGGFFFEADTA